MKTNTVFHFLVHWPVIFGGQSNRLLVSYMRTRIKVSSSKEQTSLEKSVVIIDREKCQGRDNLLVYLQSPRREPRMLSKLHASSM